MPVTHLDPEAFHQLLSTQPSIQLVDVRTPEEYVHLGHLPQAMLYPIQSFVSHVEKLNPTQPVAVYCQHGVRSLSVCDYLANQGFKDIYNLADGLASWPEPDQNIALTPLQFGFEDAPQSQAH